MFIFSHINSYMGKSSYIGDTVSNQESLLVTRRLGTISGRELGETDDIL